MKDNIKIKFYTKSYLAKQADVSYSTFYRYLKSRRKALNAMGISIYAKKLPAEAVKLLAEDYCFEV